jgi:hypothetical protein
MQKLGIFWDHLYARDTGRKCRDDKGCRATFFVEKRKFFVAKNVLYFPTKGSLF